MFNRDVVECLTSQRPSLDVTNADPSGSDLPSKAVDHSIDKSAGLLKSLFKSVRSKLEVLVDVVSRSLRQHHRLSVNALLTIYVHCRDVVQMLIDRNVTDISDFHWSRCVYTCAFRCFNKLRLEFMWNLVHSQTAGTSMPLTMRTCIIAYIIILDNGN
jgi:hypothetical protein